MLILSDEKVILIHFLFRSHNKSYRARQLSPLAKPRLHKRIRIAESLFQLHGLPRRDTLQIFLVCQFLSRAVLHFITVILSTPGGTGVYNILETVPKFTT